jgi:hypothetical protein
LKRLLPFVILAAALVGIEYYRHQQIQGVVTDAEAPVPVTGPRENPADRFRKTDAGNAAQPPAPRLLAKKPQTADPPGAPPTRDPRTVDFVVNSEGLAVAFGDVLLGKADGGGPGDRGNYEPSPPRTWENPLIPYLIHPSLPNKEAIERAIAYLARNTPVKFVPFKGEADAVSFEPGNDQCLSYVGKQGGVQPIRLSPGCGTQEILHEMLHALGFIHEHSRTDRDAQVAIEWDHIDAKYRSQFDVVPESWMENVRNFDFDHRSIMHYTPDAFARAAGLQTIRTRVAEHPVDPVKEGLSPGDLKRLRKLYEFW